MKPSLLSLLLSNSFTVTLANESISFRGEKISLSKPFLISTINYLVLGSKSPGVWGNIFLQTSSIDTSGTKAYENHLLDIKGQVNTHILIK